MNTKSTYKNDKDDKESARAVDPLQDRNCRRAPSGDSREGPGQLQSHYMPENAKKPLSRPNSRKSSYDTEGWQPNLGSRER